MSGPIHGQFNYMEYKQNRIYINIGMEEKNNYNNILNKMCNKIKCAGQLTVDLKNHNINRNVQEECCTGYLHSINMNDRE